LVSAKDKVPRPLADEGAGHGVARTKLQVMTMQDSTMQDKTMTDVTVSVEDNHGQTTCQHCTGAVWSLARASARTVQIAG